MAKVLDVSGVAVVAGVDGGALGVARVVAGGEPSSLVGKWREY